MSPLFYDLRATNPAKNLHRFYKIEVGQDLFNAWFVSLYYGRQGTKGRRQNHSFDTEAAARSFVAQKLKNRLAFRQSRGCAYRLMDPSF